MALMAFPLGLLLSVARAVPIQDGSDPKRSIP